LTPTESKPMSRLQQSSAQLITSARGPPKPNLVQMHPLDPLRISTTVEASNFKFGTQLGFGTSLPKTTFRAKIGGGLGQGSIRKKFGSPYVFLQPLKLATLNLVHNFGLGLAYQKQRLGPRGSGPGEHSKNIWDRRQLAIYGHYHGDSP